MLDAALLAKIEAFCADRELGDDSADLLEAFLNWLNLEALSTREAAMEKVDNMPTLVELRQVGEGADQAEPSEAAEVGAPKAGKDPAAASVQPGPAVSAPPSSPSNAALLETTAERTIFPGAKLPSNLEDQGRLGLGGTGEVRRVLDRNLNRLMAIKLLRSHLAHEGAAVTRFLEEAQVTAQLQHPGIVAVHDVGRLKDGQYFFTMEEVSGRTLKDVIAEVHQAVVADTWRETPSGWTFRGLIDAFRRVCQAMAYAHARGVVHRDLKPSNIMLGEFGEVLVLDWGIAKVMGKSMAVDMPLASPVQTRRSESNAELTLHGEVPGTPAYMPVEQARGNVSELGPASDVYSLGAILYTILSGRPPYHGADGVSVLMQVLKGPPSPVGRQGEETAESLLPLPLKKLCDWTLEREPSKRPQNASEVEREVAQWLEGAKRRAQAEPVLSEADALLNQVREKRVQATQLRSTARDQLSTIESWVPVSQKKPAWQMEAQAFELECQADREEMRYLHSLRMALSYAPDMPAIHKRLAEHYYRRHAQAESQGNASGAGALELLLKEHDRVNHYDAYLRGDGKLTLRTDPPGAEAVLFRCEEVDRRLELVRQAHLGQTPLDDITLPRGSYVVKLKAPGCDEVIYPIEIRRDSHWDGIRPGDKSTSAILLPKDGALDIDDIYIPGGWFRSGGDGGAPNSLPQRSVWLDPFIVQKYPVTHRDYLFFLNDLVEKGRSTLAEKCVPRTRNRTRRGKGNPIYILNERGRYHLPRQMVGGSRATDWPVTLVDWRSAWAYAAWMASRTKLPWRLPWELEWEKAARGVDGRKYPWGNFFDATWTCVRESHAGTLQPGAVDAFVGDVSIYGVSSMAGNVMEPCADAFTKEGPLISPGGLFNPKGQSLGDGTLRTIRGGSWNGPARGARLAGRHGCTLTHRAPFQGIRLCRSVQGKGHNPIPPPNLEAPFER